MSKQLAPERQAALERRLDKDLDGVIDKSLEVVFSNVDQVGPDQRHQLRSLIRYYAKKAKPFTEFVRDNTERFGPGRVEKIGAIITNIIRGTTHWRGHPELDHGSSGVVAASDDRPPQISDETAEVLLSIEKENVVQMIFTAAEKAGELHV